MGEAADPDPAQQDWVARVLNVIIPDAEHERRLDTPASGPVLPIWVEAKEAADGYVEKLQQALRGDGDEDLRAIAEFGLHGVTRGESVRLMAALRDADSAPSPETRGKAADAVDAFSDFLDSSPAVAVIEDNPMGVAVPMRETLRPALGEILRVLGA